MPPAAAAAVAVVTDFKTGLIYNWLTVPLFAGALAWATVTGGLPGAGTAVLAGLMMYFSVFAFAPFAGGDFKLAVGIGAWLLWGHFLPCFLGAAATRVVLALLLRARVYGWRPLSTARGIWMEMVTMQLPVPGEMLRIPRALWLAGGVVAVWMTEVL